LSAEKITETLTARKGNYDPEILVAVLADNDAPAASAPEFTAAREIALKDLLPGMVLAADVLTKTEMLIVKSKTKISPILLQRLHNFAQLTGIKEPVLVQ
jgi:hypothetical protein